ncbi:MAG: hypothetical protein HY920_08450 [Elusimicrobia bacterium]|nr:hypothetical protein [Elusimicrobiota bacterium]
MKLFPTGKKLFLATLFMSAVSFGYGAVALAEKQPSTIPSLTISVQPQKIMIGDPIAYQVTIKIPADFEILEDSSTLKPGEFVIRDLQQKRLLDKKNDLTLVLRYTLTIYDTGKKQIPGYLLSYRRISEQPWRELTGQMVEIEVQSLLAKAKKAELKSLKPKYTLLRNPYLWGLLLVILVAGALIWFFYFRRRLQLQSQPLPKRPAHVIAYEELEKIRNSRFLEKGMLKEYFAELSGCLRGYLENRFNLRAPWLSTEEFLEQAKTSPALNKEQNKLLKNFLSLADLVKFAKYSSSPQEAENAYQAVKDFVDQTREQDEDAANK